MKNHLPAARGSKINLLLYGAWGILFIIIARLFYLQVDKQGLFTTLGQRNFMRIEVISPLRGDLYDRNKVLLAANRPVYDVSWHNLAGGGLTAQDLRMLNCLGMVLDIPIDDPTFQQQINYANKFARRILLKSDVTFEQLCRISEQCNHAPNILITHRFKRVYPHNDLACHVLGYLNRVENTGKSGIEHQFDGALQGEVGQVVHVINATGKTLMKKIQKQAQAGTDITLTLDLELQKLAQGLFTPDQAGAFIVMDPANGAIKTLVSSPTFNPNSFLSPLTEDAWQCMAVNNPLLNRATCALYPPASTFKIVAITAGLEEKIIDPNGELFCCGHVVYGGRRYYCIRHEGHGHQTQRAALAVSCNIPFFNLARKIKIDKIAFYAAKYGLGCKTDLALPEKAGLVPSAAWKKQALGERWWKGETLSACIGQGYLLVTPLQVARMVSAVCTGYLVKPRLLEKEPIVTTPLAVAPETLTFIRNAMHDAGISGSAQRLHYISGFDIWAKTGTAQTCGLSVQQTQYKHHLEHGWFCCFFTYKNSPPLVLTILLENVGSSSLAVTMADKFLRGYRSLQEKA